ncbi:MAG: LysM peptidoglycan-binding domain-containing protein [Eubacteriales bacterium]|nr:LysM peptidoglycan-binding domain-containing protein [Eubacteriales bacterium]
MIEVIYKEEKQEAKGNEGVFSIPRNIRQIGLISEDYRIYVEDYVYTFLGRFSGVGKDTGDGKGVLAVLMGDTKWAEGITYVFIRGALAVENVEAAADHIDFTEEVWTVIHEEEARYFPGQEIVGWFFAQPQLPLNATETFTRAHLKYFGGEKVLMLMDPVEREDSFFRYENSFLVKQSGYYLYYERNPLMQAYMLDKNPDIPPEVTEGGADNAVKSFRKIIRNKKEGKPGEAEDRPSVFSYAATACLVLAVVAAGTNLYRNYQEMQSVTQKAEEVSSANAEAENSGLVPAVSVTSAPAADTAQKASDIRKAANTDSDETAGQNSGAGESAGSGQDSGAGERIGTGQDSASGESAGTGQDSASGESAESGQSTDAPEVNGNDNTDENSGADENDDTKEIQSSGAVQGTEQAESGTENQNTAEDDVLYKQESDIRKAKRKEALAKQEQAADGQDSSGQEADQTNEQEASGVGARSSYVIRPGDTLYQISMERYGSMDAVEEICKLNGLSANEIIYPGQIIVLP